MSPGFALLERITTQLELTYERSSVHLTFCSLILGEFSTLWCSVHILAANTNLEVSSLLTGGTPVDAVY